MAVLVCGSVAFDTIMNFEGSFGQQILPNQLHILNVSFLVNTLRRDYGGCAGNIAYGLKLLGGEPRPMAAVGQDGGEYLERLDALGIDRRHILLLPDTNTAQCMIMTDRDNNQIAAFHPGAMLRAHENRIIAGDADVALAIISPDGHDAMLQHAQQLSDAGIPWVFDPGQGLPMFDGQALRRFVEQASWVTVNDYEGEMLSARTGWSLDEIASRVKGLVVTLAAHGCDVWEGGRKQRIAAIAVADPVDPTGCGDAWRAALLYGLERGWSMAQCARLGNAVAARKVAVRGPQGYTLDGLDIATFSESSKSPRA